VLTEIWLCGLLWMKKAPASEGRRYTDTSRASWVVELLAEVGRIGGPPPFVRASRRRSL
jgi:hypothetical protein